MISAIPAAILPEIDRITGSTVTSFSFAGGGCINESGICVTPAGSVFLKWNDRKKYPGMFDAEAKGLSLLRKGTALHVPEVLLCGETGSFQFLLLETIREGRRSNTYWETFGRGLAMLHRNTMDTFGLDHDNYIGSLPQTNAASPSWSEFFEQRLRKLLKMALDTGRVEITMTKKFESLFLKLNTLLPKEVPSLLHGDLWGGNIMTNDVGQPVLIDPAVYFGHREADLAMTQLFGGFDERFMRSYEDVFPLSPGFEMRRDIFNLYPLLVHVNLFGGSYGRQVLSIVNRFV